MNFVPATNLFIAATVDGLSYFNKTNDLLTSKCLRPFFSLNQKSEHASISYF